jgi:SNF2 family DNA or RNA helicase
MLTCLCAYLSFLDEMGMGKTIQTIALFLSDEGKAKAPSMVVA